MVTVTPRSPLHVAYVVHGFPERSETFVANEIDHVRRAGVEVTLHAMRPPQVPAPDLAERAGVEADRLPDGATLSWGRVLRELARLATTNPVRVLRAMLLLLRDPQSANRGSFKLGTMHAAGLRGRGVDLIHAHFADFPASIAMFSAALLGVPFTFTGHAFDLFLSPFDLQRKMRRAAVTVDVCDYNRRRVREVEGDVGTHVYVPCGVDVEAFEPTATPADADPHVVAIGRLVPKKGFADLIDALALLRDEGRLVDCTIVGDGPLMDELTAQVRATDLSDRVALVGSQPAAAVRDVLATATVFCLPCVVAPDGDRDSQPVVIKEAMAMGVPVVGTAEVGIPEMVVDGETGRLVPPHDPAALASALGDLLADPDLRATYGAAGRRRVETTFSFDLTVGRLIATWQSILGRSA